MQAIHVTPFILVLEDVFDCDTVFKDVFDCDTVFKTQL
jgi:hypothetical protein